MAFVTAAPSLKRSPHFSLTEHWRRARHEAREGGSEYCASRPMRALDGRVDHRLRLALQVCRWLRLCAGRGFLFAEVGIITTRP